MSSILSVGFAFLLFAICKSSWAFKDVDWTHSFHERCGSKGGFANGSEVNWLKEGDTKFLRFTLAGGQKGNCSRDKKRRKNLERYPHWERSEIISGPDSRNKFLLRSGGHYKINLRVRFVEGFLSDKESILQLYSGCPWKGRCSPLMMLKSFGHNKPGSLRTVVLKEKIWKEAKKSGNWNSKSILNDYRESQDGFLDNNNTYFSPTTHKGKWINIIFVVSMTPKEAVLKSKIVADSVVWTSPEQTIDIPPGYPDPHVVLGLYRPGSDSLPNPTSTIDFDYIKISKMSDFDKIKK